MASICYLSRTAGRHDQRWVTTLRDGGHRVHAEVWTVPDALARLAADHDVDLVVAGPLTDAAHGAVRAAIAPVMGLAWGFDLLLEIAEPGARERLRSTVGQLVGLHVDSVTMAGVAQELGMPACRTSVAPWGIDVGLFTPGPPSVDAVTGWSGADRVVFSPRSWEPMYDVATVIRAFAQARAVVPGLRLVLAGGGSQEQQVHALIERLGLGADVHLPGVLAPEQVLAWLRRSALYVSASHSDGTSLSLLEALAVGVPSVVTDLPSNREWVDDRAIGRLFPVGDARALADAVVDQLTGPVTASSGRRRREVVLARGDWSTNRQVFLAGVHRALEQAR